ncbi:MAG: hypothetical protein KAJ51_05795 [Thermoplasmata archaeon]|nr:hypothetical protein [Thermoplasmata archaeon]
MEAASPVEGNVSEILADIEEEVYRTERMIKLSVALEYMIQLVEPKYKESFIRAEKNAKTIDDMNKILELAKKHIGQRTAISMLGI